jgi:hypothetical protein
MEKESNPGDYIKQLLELYRQTPGTLGRIRREDLLLALEFHKRGIALPILEKAFLLATARRYLRDPKAPPLGPVRSLHYFVPVVDELLANPLPDSYFDYLQAKTKKIRTDHNGTFSANQR